MKKFMMLFVMCVICFTTYSFADTAYNVFSVDDFCVENIHKNRIFGTFEITNLDGRHYEELKYMLYLVPKEVYGENKRTYVVAHSSKPVTFSLGARESKLIGYEYEISNDNFPFEEYVLILKIFDNASELVSPQHIDEIWMGNSNVTEFLEINDVKKTHYYKIDEFESPMSGPYFDIGESPTAYINVNSTFKNDIKVRPRINFYKRFPTFDDGQMYQQYGEEITLKANKSKELAIKLPSIKVPESYYFSVQLVDENNKPVSYEYNFRYVVNGATAKISCISTIYDQYKGILDVYVQMIGSSDDESLKDVSFYTSTSNSETGLILEQYIDKLNLEPIPYCYLYRVKIPNDGMKVTVFAIMKKDDKVLASKNLKLSSEATSISTEKFTDVKDTKYEVAVKMLNSYGVISGYPDGTFKPAKTLSRAELTSIALNMLKIDLSNYEVKNNAFVDISENHWAYKAINYAYENGIINGYGNGLFKPDNEVKYSEAITILLNTTGYKFQAVSKQSTWPDNYIEVANELEINRNSDIPDFGDSANRGEISILTLNSYFIRGE